MLRRQFVAGSAVLLFGSLACTAQPLDAGAIHVGDRWSYDVKDELTGDLKRSITVVVVEVNDKEITARITDRGKERSRLGVFAPDWGRIDDDGWKIQPSGLGIKGPLQIGSEWRSDANAVQLQNGATFRISGAAKVVSQEKATTPAGTFDTFRVDMTLRLVNTKDETKGSTWTFAVWYAPAINRWVRRKGEVRSDGRLRDSYSEELTEYSRKP